MSVMWQYTRGVPGWMRYEKGECRYLNWWRHSFLNTCWSVNEDVRFVFFAHDLLLFRKFVLPLQAKSRTTFLKETLVKLTGA